ncbi:23193_t:CDS:1, partial [Gigaspora margarita]
MVGWKKHNGIYEKKKSKEKFVKDTGKRKLVQKTSVENQNENGEGCIKKIILDNTRSQEKDSKEKKRSFTKELGENILGWIKEFLKKTWILE